MTVCIVLDTCVWLNLAGDYRHLPLLRQMAAMADENEVEFVLPDIVHAEFKRNIDRVMKGSKASQKEQFKRVRAMVKQFGAGDTGPLLSGIIDVENKLHMHADAVDETLAAVTDLMNNAKLVVPTVIARSRAATRGLEMVAPFTRNRNGVADAVILETYFEMVEENADPETRFAFITSNTSDFTDATIDKRTPHKDIAFYFDGVNSVFATDVADYFNNLMVDLDPHGEFEAYQFVDADPRVASEIDEAIELFRDQVWYNRHLHYMAQIERGEVQVVSAMPTDKPYDQTKVTEANLAVFRAAGERVRRKYSDHPEFLGPWSNFEWGMINGKLSALRWVMGEEWDFLDT